MPDFEPTSVIYWNTLYRADAQEQLDFLQTLEKFERSRGVGRVVMCLSETTSALAQDGLANLLEQADYSLAYAPVSRIKDGVYEGLAIASQDEDVEATEFHELRRARGIRNEKSRYIGRVTLQDGLIVAVAHLSYPAPTEAETIASLGHFDVDVYGGDFNTITSKNHVLAWQEIGKTKLIDPRTRVTFPVLGNLGLELDHVLVADGLLDRASLRVLPKGPSNHRAVVARIV